jgi:repressor LexA
MFFEIFSKLCQDFGKSANAVAKELRIASGTVSEWKKGRVPQNATLLKIADYFGVSVDYLLGNGEAPSKSPELTPLDGNDIHMIPLYESVSAGFGSLAINEVVDYIPLYFKSPTEAAESLCIKVTGNSMSPKIENGDIILVHKQDSVDSGSLAVVLIDGEEGLIKIVTYSDAWIELRSINPMYKPRRFNGPDVLRVRVLGRVTKIIKNVTGREETVYPPTPDSPEQRELLDLIGGLTPDQLRELQQYADFLKSKKS